jgi:membrane-associated phospholipid phosphatase
MPFVVLVVISLAAGFGQALLASHGSLRLTTGYGAPQLDADSSSIAKSQTDLQRCVAACRQRAHAAGFPLWAALAVSVGGWLLVGGLAVLLRTSDALSSFDSSAASWSHGHATGWSTRALDLVTMLGDGRVIAGLAAIVLVAEWFRERNSRVVLFLVTVTVGSAVITTGAKNLVDRARPELNPITETLGPSFPSGHSSAAAAFYTAVALILAQRRGPAAFRALISCATALGVAVASSRVLLEVHWLSDVIAGLALGWGWVACCVILIGVSARANSTVPAAHQIAQAPETGSPRP